MSVPVKKLLRVGWQVLRQTVWKEAAQPQRVPKLHAWDLRVRNKHSPNWTSQFRHVSKKLPYRHSVWETLSIRLRKDAVQRLFSPFKNGLRLGRPKSYLPYLAYGFVGLALVDNGLTNNSLHDDCANLKNLCDSYNNEEQKDKQRRRESNNDHDYPDKMTGYHFGKLIGRGNYGAIFAAKIASNQSEKDNSCCLSESGTKSSSDNPDMSMAEMYEGDLQSDEEDFIYQNERDVDISGSSISSSYWSLIGSSSSSSSSHPSRRPPLSKDEPLPDTDGNMKTSSIEDVRSSRDQREAVKITDGDFNLAVKRDVDISGSSISSSYWSLIGSSSSSSSSHPSRRPPLGKDEPLPDTDGNMKTSSIEDVRSSRDQRAVKITDGDFNLAVKIIFNDRIHSDACAIESAFQSEKIVLNKMYKLQEHPNIVKAHRSFVDDNNLDKFTEAEVLFPRALPRDKFKNGRGRNKLLYLVMHRYEMTLGQYLQSYPCRTEWDAQLMLCQLLEGSAFLCSQNIVHRDLKEDNILVELDSCGMPQLVITDFGCSLAVVGKVGLRSSRPWYEVSMAGNSALRAPEIKAVLNTIWPLIVEIDYSKSDAWAIGTIAYQICGMKNPFYQRGMDSLYYNESSLPQLPGFVSPDFQFVIWGLLKKDPSERFSSEEAANMIHLLLWKQNDWNKGPVNLRKMSYLEGNLYNWLNQIAKLVNATDERILTVKTKLLATFFSRVKSKGLLKAANRLTINRWLTWFQAEAARMNVAVYHG